MSEFTKFLLQAGFSIVLINLVGLWGISIAQQRQINELTNSVYVARPTSSPASTIVVSTASNSANVGSTSAVIAELATEIEKIDDRLVTLERKAINSPTKTAGPKEVQLYIGSGSTFNTEWKNIESATITINADNYPNLKEVRFEAALSILGGNAYARLINKHTGAVLSTSEIYNNTSSAVWKTSAPIYLNSGQQTYIVQLKSSSNEHAVMEAARIRIITE